MIFRTKSETAKDKAVARAQEAKVNTTEATEKAAESFRAAASSVLHSVSEAVAPRAEAASEAVKDRTAKAREVAADRAEEARSTAADRTATYRAAAADRATSARNSAVSSMDKGIDSFVPRAQESIGNAGTAIDSAFDSAHETLVNDVLPKLQELLGNVQTGKDDLLARTDGPIATVTGAPKAKNKRKGGALITFGVLAAVGAVVAYTVSQRKSEPEIDPWASSNGEADPVIAADARAEGPTAVKVEANPTMVDAEDLPVTDGDAESDENKH